MWCDVQPEELSAWVDGEIDSSRFDELRAHVLACPACRAELERIRRVDDSIRTRDVGGDVLALRGRLAAAVSRRNPWRRVLRVAPLAAAAIVMAMLGARCFETEPAAPPTIDPRIASQEALVDSLELDAASMRVELLAVPASDPRGRQLDSKLAAAMLRLARLRRDGLVPLKGE